MEYPTAFYKVNANIDVKLFKESIIALSFLADFGDAKCPVKKVLEALVG